MTDIYVEMRRLDEENSQWAWRVIHWPGYGGEMVTLVEGIGDTKVHAQDRALVALNTQKRRLASLKEKQWHWVDVG